jgi:AAHS family 4-hydroxybenzoate transporter-like MFS transporter
LDAPRATFNVSEFMDRQRLGGYQIAVLVFATLSTLFDGYDTFVSSMILVPMAKAFGIPPAAIAPALVAQAIGLALGALLFTPLSDRIGRRPLAIVCVAGFGALTLWVAWAHNVAEVGALRFLGGLFLGAAVPNAIAMISEVAPKRLRATTIALVAAAVALGAVGGAAVSIGVVRHWGWPGPLFVGGVLPLLLVPFLVAFLPESVRFFVTRDDRDPRITAALKRIDPNVDLAGVERFELSERRTGNVLVVALFQDDRALKTLVLWGLYFITGFVLGLLGQFWPTFLNVAGGVNLNVARGFTAVSATSGLVGTLLIGVICDRINPRVVLIATYLLAGLAYIAIGACNPLTIQLPLLMALASGSMTPTQTVLHAIATRLYPTEIRATGLGWAWGASRAGSIASPVVGGLVLSEHWAMLRIFLSICAAVWLGAVGAVVLRRMRMSDGAGAAEIGNLIAKPA